MINPTTSRARTCSRISRSRPPRPLRLRRRSTTAIRTSRRRPRLAGATGRAMAGRDQPASAMTSRAPAGTIAGIGGNISEPRATSSVRGRNDVGALHRPAGPISTSGTRRDVDERLGPRVDAGRRTGRDALRRQLRRRDVRLQRRQLELARRWSGGDRRGRRQQHLRALERRRSGPRDLALQRRLVVASERLGSLDRRLVRCEHARDDRAGRILRRQLDRSDLLSQRRRELRADQRFRQGGRAGERWALRAERRFRRDDLLLRHRRRELDLAGRFRRGDRGRREHALRARLHAPSISRPRRPPTGRASTPSSTPIRRPTRTARQGLVYRENVGGV